MEKAKEKTVLIALTSRPSIQDMEIKLGHFVSIQKLRVARVMVL